MSGNPQTPRPEARARGAASGPRTRAVHGGELGRPGPVSTPIVHSATFSFASLEAMNAEQDRGPEGSFYQRYGHPTLAACESALAALDGAEAALLFSSGMAAISCVFLSQLGAGDHVVALQQSYGGTLELLRFGRERLGWSFDLVDAREPASWAAAFGPRTRLLHVESPTNPTLRVVDLAEAARLAHARGARLTVDNTFASPLGQRPAAAGADLVLYSATKSIGGHSDLLAGAVTGPRERLRAVWEVRKILGPVPDPETAWRVERSLKTLPLRLDAANANALALARRLAEHPGVSQVMYPGLPDHPGHELAARQMTQGFGHVLAFEPAGGAPAARATIEALRLVMHATSLGGVESLASLPAFTSHIRLGPEGRAEAGIPEGLVRLSVGVEDLEDLWADLEQAIARGTAAGPGRA